MLILTIAAFAGVLVVWCINASMNGLMGWDTGDGVMAPLYAGVFVSIALCGAYAATVLEDADGLRWYLLGVLVVAWAARGIWLARQEQEAREWWERGALLWVILACATTWVNFGVFHSSRIVHYWDTFHYYVGSKYFEENEYERIYGYLQPKKKPMGQRSQDEPVFHVNQQRMPIRK